MISAKDIKDRDSLKQWLKEWPDSQGMDEEAARKVAVTIAHRVAMRVFPITWKWFSSEAARKRDLTALPFLRCSLISGVACKYPTPEIKKAADAATATAAYAADAAGDDIWGQIQDDAVLIESGEDLSNKGLWSPTPPDWFRVDEVPMLDAWQDEPETWGFWARWWNYSQVGKPLDWALQEKVALIADEGWEQVPEHVAGVIAGIEEAHLAEHTKLGETLTFNPETGNLRLDDDGANNVDRLQSCVLKLKEIDALVQQFDNYKGMLRAEVFLIQRAIEYHPDNPVILHHNAKAAREILAGNIANGNCPSFEQEPVLGLIDTTLLDVQSTLANEPSVIEANGARADMTKVIESKEVQALVRPVA